MSEITVLTASFEDIRMLDPKFAEWCEEHGREGNAVEILAKAMMDYVDNSELMDECIGTTKYMLDYED